MQMAGVRPLHPVVGKPGDLRVAGAHVAARARDTPLEGLRQHLDEGRAAGGGGEARKVLRSEMLPHLQDGRHPLDTAAQRTAMLEASTEKQPRTRIVHPFHPEPPHQNVSL